MFLYPIHSPFGYVIKFGITRRASQRLEFVTKLANPIENAGISITSITSNNINLLFILIKFYPTIIYIENYNIIISCYHEDWSNWLINKFVLSFSDLLLTF